MSKRLFGKYYYSMEDSYRTKGEAQKAARSLRKKRRDFYVRVANTGWGPGGDRWAVYVRSKK